MALTLLPNNAMTFTENQHGTAVLEKLRSQRELVRCCDVVLHVAGLQFQAHRCVLAACSPYFDSIFKASKTVKEQLTISSQDPEVFRCLLAYMYTGTVVVDKTNVAELLRLANKLLIAKLKEHCAEYLERYLDSSNCLTVRDMATKFNLEALENTTGAFIGSHLAEIIDGEEVLELSHSRLEDFLGSPCWQLREDQTLLLVTRWVYHCPKTRERNLRSLLTWVQWCRLDPQIAIQMMQNHPLYSNSSSLLSLFFLLDALNDNSLLPEDWYTAFLKLKAKYCQPTDSVVDNESFLSLAISTAIDELQEDQVASNRPQDAAVGLSDFNGHSNPPVHSSQVFQSEADKGAVSMPVVQSHQNISDFPISLIRGCEEQEDEQHTQYDLCRVNHSADDLHLTSSSVMFSHQTSAPNVVDNHPHLNDDSISDSTVTEEGKFTCNGPEHFGQTSLRNMAMWHQEVNYGNEESLSSDSGHMYQRQVYDQGFNLKLPSSDSYSGRVNQTSNYPIRDSTLKNKQSFSSAVSYYVSTYNPEDDMTVSDDQSTQSFQYDENFNPGMNIYPCRVTEVKDPQHGFLEPHRTEENYPKVYYPNESNDTQDIRNVKREMDYNENSTDTQLSNCPQDMTIQHQFSSCSKMKHDLSLNKDISMLEDPCDITQNDSNIPISLVTEQQSQYEQYPLDTTATEEEFHREVTRSSTKCASTLTSRDIADTEEIVLEGKRNAVDGDTEMRNFVFLKEDISDQNKAHKDNFVPERTTVFKSDTAEQNLTSEEPIPKHLPSEDLHLIAPLDASATSRHVKFRINRSVNLPSPGVNINGSYKQHTSSTQDVLFNQGVSSSIMTQFKMEDSNPDDPDEVCSEEPDATVKITEAAREKQESSRDEQEREEDKGGTTKTSAKANDSKDLPRRTSSRNKMAENAKDVRPVTSMQRVCDLCRSSFSRNKDYFVHMREHFPGPPHRCDTCDASFKRIYHLLDHLVIHQDTKSHKCPHCPFSTHKKFNLTEHMTQHSKVRKYKCKTCGEQFNRLQILQTHETKHTNDRPFLCETCGWSGKTKNALVIHTKIHTGDLLRCQFPNCKYETAKKSHLKGHMQSHSKSRPCICSVCGNTFITNSHLKRHMKLHLSEKPFKCFECDYATMRRDYLKTHIWKKHTRKEAVKTKERKRENKKKNCDIATSQPPEDVTNVITAHIECSQADIFSDLENTNVSLQPQLPGTPPPTTLTEYPPSPTYAFQAQSGHEDTIMIVSDMSSVAESFTQMPQASPLHRNLTSSLNYDESYHSPQYQTSPSHFAALSPTNAALTYGNNHQQEGSPLNFAALVD